MNPQIPLVLLPSPSPGLNISRRDIRPISQDFTSDAGHGYLIAITNIMSYSYVADFGEYQPSVRFSKYDLIHVEDEVFTIETQGTELVADDFGCI